MSSSVLKSAAPVTESGQVIKVIDADTHISEPHDLWTSRVPSHMRKKVPHVIRDENGRDTWFVEEDRIFQRPAGASSVVRKDGTKAALWDWDIQAGMQIDEVSEACYDTRSRLAMMDDQGIWAQIVYPNLAGFGANKLIQLEDQELAYTIVSVYNDAIAEMQAESNGRLFPQALVPFWNIDLAVREVERCATELDLRGIAMCSEPHAGGLPPLTDRHWDPLWEVCTDKKLPVNFHVGATDFGMEAFFKGAWPMEEHRRLVVGAVQLELHNARVVSNLLASDLLLRFPDIKWVSVESGIGWIPYMLERLQYQLLEQALDGNGWDQPAPKELFRDHLFACFWFEESAPSRVLDEIGFDNVMFETDFPHTTCLYPNGVAHGMRVLAPWGEAVQRKVLSENAAKLYRIDIS